MVALSLTVGLYVQMAEALGGLFISKLSTKLGFVHTNRITGVLMIQLTMGKGIYASCFRPMQSREASSRMVERKAFLCP